LLDGELNEKTKNFNLKNVKDLKIFKSENLYLVEQGGNGKTKLSGGYLGHMKVDDLKDLPKMGLSKMFFRDYYLNLS